MLKKFVSIKNVGRFLDFRASGDSTFKRYNLIFAENGRGKTTLCAILRSLQSGNGAYVVGRTTLGSNDKPEIKILTDGGCVSFDSTMWTATEAHIVIFDSTFVSENVFSGDTVDLENRRNLHSIIVGAQGGILERKIRDLDTASREKSTEVREKTTSIQSIQQGMSVETFLSLPNDPSIDAKISEKEGELVAVKQGDRIRNHADLSELKLPTLPSGFTELLGKTIDDVADDAARRIAEQIQLHKMHDRGEPWLSEGMDFITNNTCPFCGRSLEGVALIAAYKAYFSKAYDALRTEVTSFRDQVETSFSEREIGNIERLRDHNATDVEFWSVFCTFSVPVSTAIGQLEEILRSVRQSAITLLDQKAAKLLEAARLEPSFSIAISCLGAVEKDVAVYNQGIQDANGTITSKRRSAANADLRTVENQLTHLRAIKKRYEASTNAACQDLMKAKETKDEIEKQKEAAKLELHEYTGEVMVRYKETINRLLDDYLAGFRIAEIKQEYPGGVVSSTYHILINETPVELGDVSTPISKPSFRNTLSSGDKSTLALAFFLAQLEHDPDKAKKLVVFDDPFNSQDSFRRDWTIRKIKECGETCNQVMVLSHERDFLKRIWYRLAIKSPDRKCLELARTGIKNTRIVEWDIEKATQLDFPDDILALTDYYSKNAGDSREVVKRIRPVLETHFKTLFPAEFANDNLGGIIGKIRTVGPSHQLFDLHDDLNTLNEYTCRYHHGQNMNAPAERIDTNELLSSVKKTLTIVGAC